MWKIILYVLAVLAGINALIMWFAPMFWYETVPGVAMMGPFNLHFVRDIALVFLFSGGAMAYGAAKDNATAAIAGAAWPVMHAVFHIQIWMARGFPFDEVALSNLAAIQAPSWLGLYAAWQLLKQARGTGQ